MKIKHRLLFDRWKLINLTGNLVRSNIFWLVINGDPWKIQGLSVKYFTGYCVIFNTYLPIVHQIPCIICLHIKILYRPTETFQVGHLHLKIKRIPCLISYYSKEPYVTNLFAFEIRPTNTCIADFKIKQFCKNE